MRGNGGGGELLASSDGCLDEMAAIACEPCRRGKCKEEKDDDPKSAEFHGLPSIYLKARGAVAGFHFGSHGNCRSGF